MIGMKVAAGTNLLTLSEIDFVYSPCAVNCEGTDLGKTPSKSQVEVRVLAETGDLVGARSLLLRITKRANF